MKRYIFSVFIEFQHVINLSFMDAAKGCNKDITTRTRVICNRCNGKRAEPGTTYSQCSTCKGTGEVCVFLLFFHCTLMLILWTYHKGRGVLPYIDYIHVAMSGTKGYGFLPLLV